MPEITWEELAAQEHDAAMKGGRVWAEFVQTCEHLTGQPWSVIRERFNELNKHAEADRG